MVCGRQTLPRVGSVLRLKCKENDKRPSLDGSSPLTSRTMLTRTQQRSCAIPSSITISSWEGHQRPLPRAIMRTFPTRPRGLESCWKEPRPNTHLFMCLPLLDILLPQKMHMNFSCQGETPLIPCNHHTYLCSHLRLIFFIYNEVVGLIFI